MVLRETVSDNVPYIPRYTLFLIPQHEVVSTLKAKITMIFWWFSNKEAKTSPWSKPKLYFEAPVSSYTGRTENTPLPNKRLDELIECN